MGITTTETKEGKAKRLYLDSATSGRLEFKDSLTAFNGQKKDSLAGKGVLNATISAKLFNFLSAQKINSHFIKQASGNILEVKPLQMIPLEVIVRNYAAGSICKRLGITQGKKLQKPIIQFHLKDDNLNDPLLTENEIFELNLISSNSSGNSPEQILNLIKNQALTINWLLSGLFEHSEITLIDLKLEFGLDQDGNLTLADELSPDNMRLWNGKPIDGDILDIQKLDKDRFREGLGNVLENYQFILDSLNKSIGKQIEFKQTPVLVKLKINPQKGLLDPTGRTLTDATNRLGFKEVQSIRAGKNLEIELKDFRTDLIEELCDKILVSPASEEYEYEITPL
ncbi:MAG: phosphoribosylaminoimidazolesuccinocarboxamide synthase [Candidatus Melainabacteria bacterium]|jgi:phosphoribosylaminoimidazole-succinocarboxamide synthase